MEEGLFPLSASLPLPLSAVTQSDPRALYESLLKKTQKMLKDTQIALETERKTHLSELRASKARFTQESASYREENDLLRSELQRFQHGSGDLTLRKTFCEQLEATELSAKQVETALRQRLAAVEKELDQAGRELAAAQACSAKEKAELKGALEELRRENDHLSKQLSRTVGDLKDKLLHSAQTLSQQTSASKQTKALYQSKLTTVLQRTCESDALWLREKQDLVALLAKAAKEQAEKGETLASQIGVYRSEKDNLVETLRQQVQLLERDRETAATVYEESIAGQTDREVALEREIVRLQNSLSRVMEHSHSQETRLRSEVERLGAEVQQAKQKTTLRDESFLQFTCDFRTALGKYTQLLADLQLKPPFESGEEGPKLQQKLAAKDAELISLRNMYISARQSSTSPLSKSLSSIETAANSLLQQQTQLVSDLAQALRAFKNYLETCTQELPEVTASFPAMLGEITTLRAARDEARAEVRRLEGEVEQAQGVIAGLLETVGRYESVDGADSRADIRAEALERELAQLRSVKVAREKALLGEIETLRTDMQAKTAELEESCFEIMKCKAVASSAPSETAKSLQTTLNSASALAEQLQFQLLELQTSTKEPANFLASEEIELLRKETQKSEEMYQKMTTTWGQSQSLLREEVTSQQQALSSLEGNQARLQGLLAAQHSLLALQAEQLQQLKESTAQSLQLTFVSGDEDREDTSKGEVKTLREEMRTLVQSHSQQIEELKRFYEGEIRKKQAMETATAQESRLQASNRQQLAAALVTEREMHQSEVSHLREEVKRLRSHCIERYQLLQRDRKQVLAELQALLGFVGKQEEQDRRTAYEGLKKAKELLDTVKGDRRQFDKVQQIKEELKALRALVDEKSSLHAAEYTALEGHFAQLAATYETLQSAIDAERTDQAVELDLCEARVQALEKECAWLRQQRDDAVLLNRL